MGGKESIWEKNIVCLDREIKAYYSVISKKYITKLIR